MAPASSSDLKTTLCFSNEGLRERLEPKYRDPLAIENIMAKHKPFAIIARAYMAKGHGQTGGGFSCVRPVFQALPKGWSEH